MLRFYLISVSLFMLSACSEQNNKFETVYDLPRENFDIKYEGFRVKEEKESVRIFYRLPEGKKTTGLFFRSQFDRYFLESVARGDRQYEAVLNKLLLKNGVYEIGICPDVSAPEVIFSGYFVSTSPLPEQITTTNSDELLYSIEKFTRDSSSVQIQGWAYVKGQSMNYRIINIGLIQDSLGIFYETELQERKDVTSYFNPGFNVDYSGFHAIIPTKEIEKGVHNIAIKITNLVDSTQFISLTEKDLVLPQLLDSLPLETGNLSYSVEQINDSNKFIQIKGWAYLNGKSTRNAQIYLLFKSDVVYAIKVGAIERKDVTSFFRSQFNIDRSGFDLKLDHGLSKFENYQLGILIVNETDYGVAYSRNSLNLSF